MNLKNRVDRLSADNMQGPVIVLVEGEGPTEAQRLQIDKAAAAGIKPHIIQIVPASKVQHGS